MESTQQRDQQILHTKLDRVISRSRQDRGAEFNNLGHIVDLGLLRECYKSLDGSKAVGIDKVTKEDYGRKLTENLQNLILRIRRGSYHPQPSRIVEIEKPDGSTRPLAIACFEDKIVQTAVKKVMECIYEPIFSGASHGFRPNRGCQTALVALNEALMGSQCGAVLEIDLRKYFNSIPHKPLEEMLRLKIKDERFLHLLLKLLKAPTVGKDGVPIANEIGSPQGSIASPVIANIYLHYVLDIWVAGINESRLGGSARMVRYADDAVFVFRNVKQAELFKMELEARLQLFGISLHEGKTKIIPSGKVEAERLTARNEEIPTFTFLGFLHVWGQAHNRKTGKIFWRIKRRTCPVRFRKKLKLIKDFIKLHRHDKKLFSRVKAQVVGYLGYFAINDNSRRVSQFLREVTRLLFKWLNRRSQKRSYTWERFRKILVKVKFPTKIKLKPLFFDMSRGVV